MLRLGIAIAIVGTIFMHSPERRPESLATEMANLKDRVQGELVASVARSPLAQSIAESSFRRTLSDETLPVLPRRDERAAVSGQH